MARTAEEMRTGAADRSTAALIRQATEQVATLVRDELRLAQLEMIEKARLAGTGAGLLAGAGVVAGAGAGVLLGAAVIGLATVLPAWASALIIGGALVFIAAMAGLWGGRRLRRARPPTPSRALHGAREDLHAITAAARTGER